MKKVSGAGKTARKVWNFLWNDDSIWSWIANIAIAFIVIKFIIYPFLGLVLSTTHPVVAVVSGSMEHGGLNLDEWYGSNQDFYEKYNITKEDFSKFSFKNGFNKGDIMILLGKRSEQLGKGDIIVFFSGQRQPIIHRIINRWEVEGSYYFQTKGDNNPDSIARYSTLFNSDVPKGTPGSFEILDETEIHEGKIIGKAVARVPFLGYIKIGFTWIVRALGIIG